MLACFHVKTVSKTTHIGNIGETIAAEFLRSKGYQVCVRNYRKPWGEIDIIARKGDVMHFVEVKTISRENKNDVSRESDGAFRAEDQMHPEKIARLQRTIQTYNAAHALEDDWQLDLIAVTLFVTDKRAECLLLENVL